MQEHLENIFHDLNAGIAALIGSIIVFVSYILRNSEIQENVVKYLSNKLNLNVLSHNDLKSHEFFMKTREMIESKSYHSLFDLPQKAAMFDYYTTVIGQKYFDAGLHIVKLTENNNLSTNEFKNLVQKEVLSIFPNIDTMMQAYIYNLINDNKKAQFVVNKLGASRKIYENSVIANIILIYTNSKIVNKIQIADRVLVVLTSSIGFTYLNGIDTFNHFGQSIDNFLNTH